MAAEDIPEIEVHALAEKIRSEEEFILLDVREEWELARARIADRRMLNIPMSQLTAKGKSVLTRRAEGSGGNVYVICHHGVRSSNVTRWLIAQGWRNVFSVHGGVDEYARKIDPSVGLY